jgi:hypothetical protein
MHIVFNRRYTIYEADIDIEIAYICCLHVAFWQSTMFFTCWVLPFLFSSCFFVLFYPPYFVVRVRVGFFKELFIRDILAISKVLRDKAVPCLYTNRMNRQGCLFYYKSEGTGEPPVLPTTKKSPEIFLSWGFCISTYVWLWYYTLVFINE